MQKEAQPRVPERLLGQDFGPEGLRRVLEVLKATAGANRNQIARGVCEAMGWINPAGQLRLMSARAGLLKLHRAGLIQLPPPGNGNANGRTREWQQLELGSGGELLSKEEAVTARIDQLGALWLRPVKEAKDSALYYALLDRYHYLGAKLGGSPYLMRYLFGVEQRLLGVIGFGPAAWKVAARDQFLGWPKGPSATKPLELIVNNLRFLILPWVRCPNLASAVLGRCARRLPQDFLARYGYAPVLLETFVERERFLGSCYRAANWLCVGQTRGRGKRDQFHRANLVPKDVWLYPLRRDFRRYL